MAFKSTRNGKRKPAQHTLGAEHMTNENSTATIEDIRKAVEDFKDTQEKATARIEHGVNDIRGMAEDIMSQVVKDIQGGTQGNTAENTFCENADEEANKIKVSFFNVLGVMKRVSGLADAAEAVYRIIAEGKGGIGSMAAECRACMKDKYNKAVMMGNNTKARILSYLIHEGDIFDMFIVAMDKTCGLISKGLHMLGVQMDKSTLLGGMYSAVSHIAGIMLKGIKITCMALLGSASYFLAVVIKAADWAVRTVTSLVVCMAMRKTAGQVPEE